MEFCIPLSLRDRAPGDPISGSCSSSPSLLCLWEENGRKKEKCKKMSQKIPFSNIRRGQYSFVSIFKL